jgi:excisionase family DNA binding protein
MRKTTSLSIEDRIRSGGLISLSPEFCDWASISRVTAYKLIAEGQLRVVKVGRSTRVTGEDATAWRDRLRAVAESA